MPRTRAHPRRAPAREGTGPRAQGGLARIRGRRARLHGRRPVDRPQSPHPPRRTPHQRSLGRLHRIAIVPLQPGRARPQARIHLPRVQPPPPRQPGGVLQRRPVRLQGDPPRRRPVIYCRWSRTTTGSSTPNCSCSPNGPGCGSTRCPSTGSTTPAPPSTSSPPPPKTSAASGDCPADSPAARIPIERLAAELVRRDDTAAVAGGVPAGLTGQLLRFALVGVAARSPTSRSISACGRCFDAQASNLLALLTTAIANTAVNRIVTFQVRGSSRFVRDHLGGLAAFGVGLVLTSGSLWLVHLGGRARAAGWRCSCWSSPTGSPHSSGSSPCGR